MNAKILGFGHATPNQKITNNFFTDTLKLDTSDAWIKERTGIETRFYANNNTSSADLGAKAAENCLVNTKVTKDEIDLILVATSTPDYLAFPSTACLIQEKLACKHTPAFDISAACSGFCFALSTAEGFIKTGHYNNILVIGVDCLSKITNMQDRTTCILFADGAGAAIVQKTNTEKNGILYSKMYSNGQLNSILSVPKGGSKEPISESIIKNHEHLIQMDGRAVFKAAIQNIIPAIKTALTEANLNIEDINYLACHQANQRILENIASQLSLPPEKLISNVKKYGNTSAASIPLALSEHHENNPFKKGDIIILAGFGAGFTWGVNIIKWI